MRRDDIQGLKGKKVVLILKNGYNYTGEIININDETITIFDKFNTNVSLDIGSISAIEEVKE